MHDHDHAQVKAGLSLRTCDDEPEGDREAKQDERAVPQAVAAEPVRALYVLVHGQALPVHVDQRVHVSQLTADHAIQRPGHRVQVPVPAPPDGHPLQNGNHERASEQMTSGCGLCAFMMKGGNNVTKMDDNAQRLTTPF